MLFKPCPILFAGALLAPAGAAIANEYASWRAALNGIRAANFPQLEELEVTSVGGFEGEVFDAAGREVDVRLADTGRLLRDRAEAHDSDDARIDIASALKIIDWLEVNGYRGLHSIGAEGRGVEIETGDGKGGRLELNLELDAAGIRLVRAERD